MSREWTAKLVGMEREDTFHPVIFKDFYLDDPVLKATLYITSNGLFEAYINGRRVGDEYLTPYQDMQADSLQYYTFDVTDYLNCGPDSDANTVDIFLGKGWETEALGDRFAVLAEFEIEVEKKRPVRIQPEEAIFDEFMEHADLRNEDEFPESDSDFADPDLSEEGDGTKNDGFLKDDVFLEEVFVPGEQDRIEEEEGELVLPLEMEGSTLSDTNSEYEMNDLEDLDLILDHAITEEEAEPSFVNRDLFNDTMIEDLVLTEEDELEREEIPEEDAEVQSFEIPGMNIEPESFGMPVEETAPVNFVLPVEETAPESFEIPEEAGVQSFEIPGMNIEPDSFGMPVEEAAPVNFVLPEEAAPENIELPEEETEPESAETTEAVTEPEIPAALAVTADQGAFAAPSVVYAEPSVFAPPEEIEALKAEEEEAVSETPEPEAEEEAAEEASVQEEAPAPEEESVQAETPEEPEEEATPEASEKPAEPEEEATPEALAAAAAAAFAVPGVLAMAGSPEEPEEEEVPGVLAMAESPEEAKEEAMPEALAEPESLEASEEPAEPEASEEPAEPEAPVEMETYTETIRIGTDETWGYYASDIERNDLFEGEVFNRVLWDENENPEKNVVVLDVDLPVEERTAEPVMIQEFLPVKETIIAEDGNPILDFGQVFTGFVTFDSTLQKGEEVKMTYTKNLYKKGIAPEGSGSFAYISDGVPEMVSPHFAFFTSRYVKVEGFKEGFDADDFTACVFFIPEEQEVAIETGNENLNRFAEAALVPVKPDRAASSDADSEPENALFSPTAIYNLNAQPYLEEYLQILRTEEGEAKAETAENIWNLYLLSGDRAVLEENFDLMKAYADAMLEKQAENEEEEGDAAFLRAADLFFNLKLISRAAKELENEQDAFAYERTARKVRQSLIEEYFTMTGRFALDTQAAYAAALRFGLYVDKDKTCEAFRRRIEKDGRTICCKGKEAAYIAPVLAKCGMKEAAYDLLLTEEEDPLGAVWFLYAYTAGIKPLEPGFTEVEIAPVPDGRIGYCHTNLLTKNGTISANWDLEDDGTLQFRFEIPEGVTAKVVLPNYPACAADSNEKVLESGNHDFSYVPQPALTR